MAGAIYSPDLLQMSIASIPKTPGPPPGPPPRPKPPPPPPLRSAYPRGRREPDVIFILASERPRFQAVPIPRLGRIDYLSEQPVNALLGLGHGLFLPQCQGTQSRSGKQGQVGARGIDAHTPSGPLPVRHNVISAISAGFRCNHLSGPR